MTNTTSTSRKKITQLYLDQKPVLTPHVTELEANLLEKLKFESFGNAYNQGFLSTRDDEWCGDGGFERPSTIQWDDRQQLGGLLTSLQDKNIIAVIPEDDEIWFDVDAIDAILKEER